MKSFLFYFLPCLTSLRVCFLTWPYIRPPVLSHTNFSPNVSALRNSDRFGPRCPNVREKNPPAANASLMRRLVFDALTHPAHRPRSGVIANAIEQHQKIIAHLPFSLGGIWLRSVQVYSLHDPSKCISQCVSMFFSLNTKNGTS